MARQILDSAFKTIQRIEFRQAKTGDTRFDFFAFGLHFDGVIKFSPGAIEAADTNDIIALTGSGVTRVTITLKIALKPIQQAGKGIRAFGGIIVE